MLGVSTALITATRNVAAAVLVFGASCVGATPTAGEVVVFAASSLTEAFGELAVAFEAAYPGARVQMNFSGSQVLRMQVEQGARVDVFVSANPEHVATLTAAGHLGPGRVFGHNELVVVVPLDNPADIQEFGQLTRARRLVLAEPGVPAGRYSHELLRKAATVMGPEFRADVLDRVVSEESNVRLVRAKVELGEADAAIVYRTDASTSTQLRIIEIPVALSVRADYTVALAEPAPAGETGRRFVDFIESADGQAILRRWGFGAS
jgi:molybdate transport system substrate-binding protein